MPDPGEKRRDGITLTAVEPKDGTMSCRIFISHGRLQTVASRGPGLVKECAFIVPQILSAPTCIFEGLRWEEDEDRWGYGWRCYCGLPTQAFRRDGTSISPHTGRVYLVFVNDEAVAYNWRWENADPDNLKLPLNHEIRFKQRLL